MTPATLPRERARPAARTNARFWAAGLGALGVLLTLGAWWALTLPGVTHQPLIGLFSPAATARALMRLLLGGELWPHLLVSLRRVGVGLALAFLVGAPLGVLVGSSRWVAGLTGTSFQVLRMVSPLSWMPIAVMLLGIGDRPIFFLLGFAALWPILLSTAQGVQTLDPQWRLLGRSLSATRWEHLAFIVLPGTLSATLQGVRLAIGTLWIILVPCEMLGVQAGLGYFILDTRDRLAYPELMATVIVIGVLGSLLDALARWLVAALRRGRGRAEQTQVIRVGGRRESNDPVLKVQGLGMRLNDGAFMMPSSAANLNTSRRHGCKTP